jgi:hypothetical protein
MKLRLTSLFFSLGIAITCFSQQSTIILKGKILNKNKPISNVHIVNLQTMHGTISNKFGEFELKVAINDTLFISSIEFENRKINIENIHLKMKTIKINLQPAITKLDEVFLHNLSGNLNEDLTKTPKDTQPKHNFTYKASDLNKILPPDTHGFLDAPNAQNITDPIRMTGGGASATIPDFYMINVRKLKAELELKKAFPSKIKSDLGIDFFTKKLKIPKHKINHFLTYCEYRNIIQYYNENNVLLVIKILKEESISYHEIKN